MRDMPCMHGTPIRHGMCAMHARHAMHAMLQKLIHWEWVILLILSLVLSLWESSSQHPAMITRLRNTQTKKIGHYIHFAGNVLLWGKSSIRIEIHF